MIHPDDLEFLEKVFRTDTVSEEVVAEYEATRSLADCYGIAGPLGRSLMVPMLRKLGISKGKVAAPENVNWRENIGEPVIAQYGDRKVPGKVVGIGTNARLCVVLEGYGEVELPGYCVKLNKTELVVDKVNDWLKVEAGTAVVIDDGSEVLEGKFVSAGQTGVKVKVGNKQRTVPYDEVMVANESTADV